MNTYWRLAALPAAIAPAVAAFVLAGAGNGIPALRHDWQVPSTTADEAGYFQAMYEGWLPYGIGYPNAYPTTFLLGFAGRAIALLQIPPWWLLALCLLALAIFIAACSVRVFSTLHAPRWAAAAGATLAVCNPWVYNELVAGHLPMIAAYGATIGIVGELCAGAPRATVLAGLAIVSMIQIQFGLVVATAVLIWLLVHRRWVGAATILLVASPTILGIVAYHGLMGGIPYLLVWQSVQSVPQSQGVLLGGYFAHYAGDMLAIARWPMRLFAVAPLMAIVAGFVWKRYALLICALTFVPLLVATGSKGLIAPLYAFVVTTIPQTAVYRELYDLIGFVAVGYVCSLAIVTAQMRRLTWLALAAAAPLVAAWFLHPASARWIDARTIPEPAIARSGYRYALMPPFAPMRTKDGGSGLDPGVIPSFALPQAINKYIPYTPMFPVDNALAAYAATGNTTLLAALGVSAVYARSYLESDASALRHSISGMPESSGSEMRTRTGIAATPFAATAARLPVASIANDPSYTDVFAGDVPRALIARFGLADVVPLKIVAAPRRDYDARKDWIDARLAFAAYPALGQAFGGAYTSDPKATLRVPRTTQILVDVAGELRAASGTWRSASTSGHYRWIAVAPALSEIRCIGRCAIALGGEMPVNLPANAGGALAPVPWVRTTPWLLHAVIPSGRRAAVLRINEAYSPYWIAVARGRILPHVRIATTVNGFLDPPAGTVYVVQVVALAQLLLEIAAGLWCCVRLALGCARRLRASRDLLSSDVPRASHRQLRV